jgi:phospholipase C
LPRFKSWATAGVSAAIAATGFSVAAPVRLQQAPTGIHKIQHVVVIMQENRSFDNYFGTYPGADGIPTTNGTPTVCVPDPRAHTCVKPYPDHSDVNGGGPHAHRDAFQDVNGGQMNGFISAVQRAQSNCKDPNDPNCTGAAKASGDNDVMSYHTESDIPNYWSYAKNFVLQDHMFQPNASWSLPEHLFQVSEWSADCKSHDPASCTNTDMPTPKPANGNPVDPPKKSAPIYAWTDLTYLMHKNSVSWGYYVVTGSEPDCENDAAMSCTPVAQHAKTPGIWNPLPWFDTVKKNKQLKNIQSVSKFYNAARSGTLPAVSWVVPSGEVSEHPPRPVSSGMSYVTSLINAVMSGPNWDSTAIFVSWDDWGGFYDHVVPPKVDANGYGLRVPGLVISPYAKRGVVDHQTLSFDAYAKFIEDDFLGGQRLDPATDGRPDPRLTIRENVPILGDLTREFDFNQAPRPPQLLPVHPKTTLTGTPTKAIAADTDPQGRGRDVYNIVLAATILSLAIVPIVLSRRRRRTRVG